jgi:serine acetyltransferase
MQLNLTLTKADLQPESEIGRGLVMSHTVGSIVQGRVGEFLLLGAWGAVGSRGHGNVGAGIGKPIIGDGVVIDYRAAIQGAIVCPDLEHVPDHTWVLYSRSLPHRVPPPRRSVHG